MIPTHPSITFCLFAQVSGHCFVSMTTDLWDSWRSLSTIQAVLYLTLQVVCTENIAITVDTPLDPVKTFSDRLFIRLLFSPDSEVSLEAGNRRIPPATPKVIDACYFDKLHPPDPRREKSPYCFFLATASYVTWTAAYYKTYWKHCWFLENVVLSDEHH